MSDINDARLWYNTLRNFDYKSKYTKRKYLYGSYHNHMFGMRNVCILNSKIYDSIDVRVTLPDGGLSTIHIRNAPIQLSNEILKMQHLLTNTCKSNCRSTTGDLGRMYSLGRRGKCDEYASSKKNMDVQKQMSVIGQMRKQWYNSVFPKSDSHFITKNKSLPYMTNTLSDFMVHSVALVNSSHYDVNDDTITITTWVEDTDGNTNNWYLVFPSLSIDESDGTAIQLHHGCTISWDAAELRHASSRVEYSDDSSESSGNCDTRKK